MDISVVIRTYNESKFLGEALEAVKSQVLQGLSAEVVVVDSGSTDGTLDIAERYGCRIVHILKKDFTFGRSLNVGCEAARGKYLVFISGHCVPYTNDWLYNLVKPLEDGICHSTYGRQIGREGYTKFSENLLLEKYFPKHSSLPQEGFFCNNANGAILKSVWQDIPYDEDLTGLEDMDMAKKMVAKNMKIGYVADAPVEHIHEETWKQISTRYEREAIALQGIMPELHITILDMIRYIVSGVLLDMGTALRSKKFLKYAAEIIAFRTMQYWGACRGNHDHKKMSKKRREQYFYPR